MSAESSSWSAMPGPGSRAKCNQAGQSIARGQPWFPDVQASASEAHVERRYGTQNVRMARETESLRKPWRKRATNILP
eukprot:5939703-Prymnesium_polylepis.1